MRTWGYADLEIIEAGGHRLILQKIPGNELVGHVLAVSCGSGSDPLRRPGFAHLVEHVVCDLVPPDPSERAGGVNGRTRFDYTSYSGVGPRAGWRTRFSDLVDRIALTVSGTPRIELKALLRVVESEYFVRYGRRAYGPVEALLHEALFPKDHPYRILPAAVPAGSDTLTLEELLAWQRQAYTQARSTLVISGDVNRGQAFEAFEEWVEVYGETSPRPSGRSQVADQDKRNDVRRRLKVPSPALYCVFALADAKEPSPPPDVVAAAAFEQAFRNAAVKLSLDPQIEVLCTRLQGADDLLRVALQGSAEEALAQVADAAVEELASGISADALAAAKLNSVMRLRRLAERTISRASMIAEFDILQRSLPTVSSSVMEDDAVADIVCRTASRERLRMVVAPTRHGGRTD